MKTTRPNCFETNSSSTHSLTLHAPSAIMKPTQTFLANTEGVIEVSISEMSEAESCMTDKLAFLLSYAYYGADQVAFDRVKAIVEKFTGIPVKTVIRTYENGKYVTSEVETVQEEDSIEDAFGYFISEVSHSDAEELQDEASKIFVSDELILTFIFSNHYGFSRETYYDG